MNLEIKTFCVIFVTSCYCGTTESAPPFRIPSFNLKQGAWAIAQEQEVAGLVTHFPSRLTGAGCQNIDKLIREIISPLEKLDCNLTPISQRDGRVTYAGTCNHSDGGNRAEIVMESANPTNLKVTINVGEYRITSSAHWKTDCLQR